MDKSWETEVIETEKNRVNKAMKLMDKLYPTEVYVECDFCDWDCVYPTREEGINAAFAHARSAHEKHAAVAPTKEGFIIKKLMDDMVSKTTQLDFDMVNHPQHYAKGPIECIDWIKVELTEEEFRGYLKGNALKYIWRHEDKGNPDQDLAKAVWYLEKLREVIGG